MQLARQYGTEVPIVGIAGRDGRGAMRDFVRRYGLSFPNGADDDLSVWHRFGVRGQPAWVFIRPDGTGHLFYRPTTATVREQFETLQRLAAPR